MPSRLRAVQPGEVRLPLRRHLDVLRQQVQAVHAREVSRKLESGGFYIQTYVQDTVSTYEDCGEDLLGCRTKTTDWETTSCPELMILDLRRC